MENLIMSIICDSLFILMMAISAHSDKRINEIPNEPVLVILALGLIKCIVLMQFGMFWGLIVAVPYLVIWLVKPKMEVAGAGDIKMFAACGLYLGFLNVAIALFIMLVLISISYIKVRGSKQKQIGRAVAPFFAPGCFAVITLQYVSLIINN